MRLVLASSSPARRDVLRNAGIDPVIRVSGVDEDAIVAALPDAAPGELVVALAAAKADAVLDAVAAEFAEAVVIGCDTMLAVQRDDGVAMLGKPKTPDVALECLRETAGRSAELVTGHAVRRISGGAVTATAAEHRVTVVRFAAATDAELKSYVDTGEPLQVAGSFTLDGYGGWLVDGISGDPSNVIGISLPLTRDLLAEVGIDFTELWDR